MSRPDPKSAELVTLATFDNSAEASIVRNQLEAAGIRTFLADDATIGMAWHLGVAVGGVKLQVAERDAERALAELESLDVAPIGEDEWRTGASGDRLDADAEDADDAEDEEDENEDTPATTEADKTVARALDAAVIGLFLLPFQLYSLWLLARLATSPLPLTPRNRKRAILALLLDLPVIILISIWLWSLFSG